MFAKIAGIGSIYGSGYWANKFYREDYPYNKTILNHIESISHGAIVGTYVGFIGTVTMPVWVPYYTIHIISEYIKPE